MEKFREERAGLEIEKLVGKVKDNEILEIVDMDRKGMIKTAEFILSKYPELTIILANKDGDVIGMSERKNVIKLVKELCKKCGGSGGGKGRLAQGKLDVKKLKKFL